MFKVYIPTKLTANYSKLINHLLKLITQTIVRGFVYEINPNINVNHEMLHYR